MALTLLKPTEYSAELRRQSLPQGVGRVEQVDETEKVTGVSAEICQLLLNEIHKIYKAEAELNGAGSIYIYIYVFSKYPYPYTIIHIDICTYTYIYLYIYLYLT